ncbi:hypothetical protein [Roseibium alexandrii]|uniref:Uncharacterized protein n=1 Tax=Roseibium alexandrii TaxID=388408 RepID=A0A0M7AUX2_9HYPH|nr:hypothetical protein [Roseibium alexandrii]CTQ77384.1 hypothetical protein LAX5112_04891 [Roseibium alexandrii]
MATKQNSEISARERFELYCADYGKTLDPSDQILDVIINAGSQLGFIFGQETADKFMGELLENVFDSHGSEISSAELKWQEFAWKYRQTIATELPGGTSMFWLIAYAKFGIVLDGGRNIDELQKSISNAIKQIEKFHATCITPPWQDDQEDVIQTIVSWSSGRHALDNGQPIEPSGLALLADVNERTVKNLMAKKQEGLRNKNGKVEHGEAVEWLESKKNYWNSVWMSQDFNEDAEIAAESEEQFVFVPVTRDGSIFHPGLIDKIGFRVGPKDKQSDCETYEEALQKLQTMPKPYWSRKNANGMRVVLSGIRWERLSLSELKKFEDDPERRLQATL